MNSFCFKGIVWAVSLASAGALFAETQQSDCDVYMVTQDDGQFCTFSRGDHWSDGKSPETDGAGKTYFVPADKQIIMYPSTDMAFGGKMLALAGKAIQKVGSGKTVTWPELRMLSGSIYTWEAASWLSGKVVVEAVESNPAVFRRPDGANYNIYADFAGEEGTAAEFHTTASSFMVWNILGDWSEYKGTVTVGANSKFIIKKNPETIAGKVVVQNGGWLYNNENTWGYTTVGALVLKKGAKLTMRMFGTNGIAPITINDELVIEDDVTLDWDNTSPSGVTTLSGSVKVALFKLSAVAAAKEFDVSGLKLPAYRANALIGPYPVGHVEVRDDPDVAGGKIVSAVYDISEGQKVYTMTKANGSAQAAQSAFTMTAADATYWDSNGRPAADAEGVLFSKEAMLWHRANQKEYAYPGLTFVLNLAKHIYNQADSVTMKRWNLFGGSGISSYAGGTGKICGPIYLYDNEGAAFSFNAFQSTTLSVCGDIHGSIDVNLTALSSQPTKANGSYCLYGDNSGFGGNLTLTAEAATGFPDIANGRYATLSVTNGNAFGGTYIGTTAWKSFHVNCYGRIIASGKTTFNEPTRGMFVEDGAQFQVTDGGVFEIGVPLTLSGEIRKTQPGTLALSGEARFEDGDAATAPVAGKNVLNVNAGKLKVASVQAVNGMAITFAKGTKLVLDAYPTAAGMADTGFVATRWATPLATLEDDGVIPVELDLPEGKTTLDGELTLPICTVTADAAKSLKFRLPKFPTFSRVVKPRTNDDGSVTFVGVFEHRGLSVIIR